VQGAFATVVWVVSGVGVVGAVVGLMLNRRTWDQYGSGHLVLDSEQPDSRRSCPSVDLAERDEEVHQMLEARNARRRRRGEDEIDVEQEMRRLTAPAPGVTAAVDAELREEIRDMAIARNHRRARRGEPALDVDAEVERQIAELSPPIK
jgi:hypothetical protein